MKSTADFLRQLLQKSTKFTDSLVFVNTFILLLGSAYLVYEFQHEFEALRTNLLRYTIGTLFLHLTMGLLAFKILFLSYMLYKFMTYKSVESAEDHALPYCTIIVPAYNEGKLVYETLKTIAESDYPKHKLEVISVDDGSKDDTLYWIKLAQKHLDCSIEVIEHKGNKGKREALYNGFKKGKGSVFVTIDSDSIVDKNTIRNLVSPMVKDPNCGAVAGNVKVLNTSKGLIPKMLDVSFAYNFEFIRSAQSQMKNVLCTPGALAAYRKEAVETCLEDWMNQTFMGIRSDIGEDRAMTNMILKQGYDVLFQQNAVVYTKIPEKYSGLRKMFTRWERSNVRENVMMSKFAFTNFKSHNKFQARLLLVNQWLGITVAVPMLIVMLFMLSFHPILFISSTFVSILIFSSVPATFYAIKHNLKSSYWAYTYSIFYAFSLFWITPYALLTAKRKGWLTREIAINK
jgi:hyaluronan synthase